MSFTLSWINIGKINKRFSFVYNYKLWIENGKEANTIKKMIKSKINRVYIKNPLLKVGYVTAIGFKPITF